MQTTRISILLTIDELEALRLLAEQNLRDPREHLRFLLRQERIRRGVLSDVLAADSAIQEGKHVEQ